MAGIHPLCLSIPQNGMKETDAGVRALSYTGISLRFVAMCRLKQGFKRIIESRIRYIYALTVKNLCIALGNQSCDTEGHGNPGDPAAYGWKFRGEDFRRG